MLRPLEKLTVLHAAELRKGAIGRLVTPNALGRREHRIAAVAFLVVAIVLIAVDDDFVADTPPQFDKNYGTPTFPHVSCGNGPHGDMFMNYMDYVDDAAMLMFTKGQVARMRPALSGPRRDLGA